MLRLARTGFPYMYPYEQPSCDDYDPICTFKEPTESPLNDTEYPLVITTGRLPHFHHGTMRHAPFVRELMPAPGAAHEPRDGRRVWYRAPGLGQDYLSSRQLPTPEPT